MDIKRVGCLYRVSTLKQVEKNDIPMQRIACGEFIKSQNNWKLTKEYIELGVSGYKLSESKRDALQDIKKAVLNKEIDILLVFMFDRIGRREEETPFVVEWLINKGVEVWSVKEGQRKIENRADKLINYLTYWQAGGESEKTSIRVKEAQTQMAENGILTYGGKRNAPYGYEFIKSGTYTKKGVERQKLIIKKDEAEIIKDIFEMYVKKGFGIGRIAKELNDRKKKPRRSMLWATSTVGAILGNPIYMGFPAYKKKTTTNATGSKKQPFENWILPKKKVESLAIIDEEMWYEAKKIREDRAKNLEFAKPRQTKSPLLLSGIVKCGECGYTFTTSESKKKKPDGGIWEYYYYKCSSTINTNTCCLEKKSIKKEVLEEIVLKCVYNFLDSLEQVDLSEAIKQGVLNNCDNDEKELKKCETQINEIDANIKVLKDEVVKTLTGESSFTAELLNELISEKEKQKIEIIETKNCIENKIRQKKVEDNELLQIKERIPIWKEEFENADIVIKKMLLSEIIKEIRIYNDRYEIDFRVQLNKYLKAISEIDNVKVKSIESKLLENTAKIKR